MSVVLRGMPRRLEEWQAQEMRRRRERGEAISTLARDYGISKKGVTRYLREYGWGKYADVDGNRDERMADAIRDGRTVVEVAQSFGVKEQYVRSHVIEPYGFHRAYVDADESELVDLFRRMTQWQRYALLDGLRGRVGDE